MALAHRRSLVFLAALLASCGEASVSGPSAPDAGAIASDAGPEPRDAAGSTIDSGPATDAASAQADAASLPDDAGVILQDAGAPPPDAGAAPPDAGSPVTPGSPAEKHAAASAACASMPLRTTGAIYYVCDCQAGRQDGCVAGTDAPDATACGGLGRGRCEQSPLQSWRAALDAFNAMNGGDTVALCKGGAWSVSGPGGVWDTSHGIANSRCAAGSSLADPANTGPCDLRDYAPSWGGTAKPLLWANAQGVTTTLLSRSGGSTNGVRVLNLDFKGGNAGPRGGVYNDHRGFTSGDISDHAWLFCNNTFEYLRIGMYPAGTGGNYDSLIQGNTFSMNDLDAILGAAGDNIAIDANLFDNNGGFSHPVSGNQAHTVYLTRSSNPFTWVSHNVSVTNNVFRRSLAGSTVGPSSSGALVSHAQYEGLNIENNELDAGESPEGGNWMVGFGAGGSEPTSYRNLTIRRNRIHAGGIGIVVGQAPGAVIENNVITIPGTNWSHGIVAPQAQSRPGGPGVGDAVQDNTIIRNNTIYITGDYSVVSGIVVGREGTGHVVANNAVYLSGPAGRRCFVTPLGHCSVTTSRQCTSDGGSVTGYTWAGPANPTAGDLANGNNYVYATGCPTGESCVEDSSAYAFIGNNSCFGGASWGTTYDATAHVTADPRFTNPPANFTPAAGSPLIGAGTAAYAPADDFSLKTRPNPPSIGAYEP